MTQLHCDVPDDIAQQIQNRANQAGISLSRYIADLIRREIATHNSWPEGYFENLGKWEGAPLERPEQLPVEERLEFE